MDDTPPATAPKRPHPLRKISLLTLRWGIAVAGLWYVISNISFYDRVLIADTTGRPTPVRLVKPATEASTEFVVTLDFPDINKHQTLHRGDLFVRADDIGKITIDEAGVPTKYDVVGLKVLDGVEDRSKWPLVCVKPRSFLQKFFNASHGDSPKLITLPGKVAAAAPYPLIDRGLGPMVTQALHASPGLLIASIFVFLPILFVQAYRWWLLLNTIRIDLPPVRVFALNMVGNFYNSFMPGSTGGDLLKAYYVAKQTPHRTRAIMSVLIDRAVGLLALVILGGVMATAQLLFAEHDPTVRQVCLRVAIGSAGIFAVAVFAAVVTAYPSVRKAVGLDSIIRRLPMQHRVANAIGTMELIGRHPLRALSWVAMTLPIHALVVFSAMFAGMAFDLPLSPIFYWTVVPVVVLAGSIPISPQGAGVMEAVAYVLTRSQGCTMGHVLALTMSIRLVQMLWNLTGFFFVIRGGFQVPTTSQQAELSVA